MSDTAGLTTLRTLTGIPVGRQDVLTVCPPNSDEYDVELAIAFLGAWLTLLRDSPLNSETEKPRRLYRWFFHQIQAEGLLGILKRFASLSSKLLDELQIVDDPDDIRLVDEFRETPIFREYHKFVQESDFKKKAVLLQYILTFLLFGKKIKIEDPRWHVSALRSWLAIESDLPRLTFCQDEMTVLENIVAGLTCTFVPGRTIPKFGPGHVAESGIVDAIDKSNTLFVSKEDSEFIRSYLKFESYDEMARWLPLKLSQGARKASRFKLASKDINTSRSICMEPNTVMLQQQAIAGDLVRCFDEGLMRFITTLQDQSRNQRAARVGSYTFEIATIDLSSASDTVAWEFARRIFRDPILSALKQTRCESVEMPDGSFHLLKKYAPMGSALCFPVQCLVYASVCLLTMMEYTSYDITYLRTPRASRSCERFLRSFLDRSYLPEGNHAHVGSLGLQPLRVYGDDICIDDRCYSSVVARLTRLGFRVNEAKSFKGFNPFRESCGGYYYHGYDVTPFRFLIPKKVAPHDPRYYLSVISLANRLHPTNYVHTRLEMVRHALYDEHGRKRPILFTRDPDRGYAILCDSPANDHLRVSTEEKPIKLSKSVELDPVMDSRSKVLQRVEYRCLVPRYLKKRSPSPLGKDAYELYRYSQWFRSKVDGSVSLAHKAKDHSIASGCRWRLAWVPAV